MTSNSVTKGDWALLFLLSFIWGCSFILIKKGLLVYTAEQVACLRIIISSALLLPIVWKNKNEINWQKWHIFFLVGITGSGVPAFLFSFAQTKVNSSVAGLLNSLTPIWTLLVGILLFNLGFHFRKFIGVMLGFLGASSLIILNDDGNGGSNVWYAFLIVIASLCYGVSVNVVQAYLKEVRPLMISAVSFFLLGPPTILYFILFNKEPMPIFDVNQALPFLSVGLLALFSTVIASVFFYRLVKRTSAVFGSTVTYLMPIVALIWGIIDGESIGIMHMMGMLAILIGVYITKLD